MPHFEAAPTSPQAELALREEQTRQLFAALRLPLLLSVLAGLALAAALVPVVPPRSLALWLGALLIVNGARFFLLIRFRRATSVTDGPWLGLFLVGVSASGLLWGSAPWLISPVGDFTHQGLVAMAVGGIAAGAVGSLSVSWTAAAAFLVPALAPLIARFATIPGPLAGTLTLLALLFLLGLLATSWRLHSSTLANITLRMDLQEREAALRESEQGYRLLFDQSPLGVVYYDNSGRILDCNRNFCAMMGATAASLRGHSLLSQGSDAGLAQAVRSSVQEGAGECQDIRLLRTDDTVTRVRLICNGIRCTDGQIIGGVGLFEDISTRLYLEALQQGQTRILELITRAEASMHQILETIALTAEDLCPHLRASILLVEGKILRHAAAPSLPEAYIETIDGLPVGPAIGSCGSAAHAGKRVVVEDVRVDPRWRDHWRLGEQFGFRACWSQPITDSEGQVLGTFAGYHREPGPPKPHELRLVEAMAHLAGIAIERARAEERRRLAATVFENTAEGIMITDAEARIVDVNQAFLDITGYRRQEVVGQTPGALMHSGRQDARFYAQLWDQIKRTGRWRGEIWNRRRDQSHFAAWESINRIADSSGRVTHYVAVISDITQIKRSEEELTHLAHHDPLTGLPNRLLLDTTLGQSLRRARRHQSKVAVVFADIDRFKNINDSLGHTIGDQLLVSVAERLRLAIRNDDVVARLSGDEFVILLHEVRDKEATAAVVEKLMGLFAQPLMLDGHEIRASTSMGVSLYPDDGTDGSTLLRNADAAMYRAKESERGTYAFYSEELAQAVFNRLLLESALRGALERSEFSLVFQPQLNLTTGRCVGCEALLRWNHPELGMVPPGKFIPLAEETGLIHGIGHWVLDRACAQGKAWLDQGLDFGRIAVNVAGPQIQRGDLAQKVRTVLQHHGLPPERLELEVTEGFIMGRTEHALAQLHELRESGVHLSIDDFGTGYSSLSYLKRLPVEKLKIDQSFVRDTPSDAHDVAIVEAVIALGRALELTVIAEGVETAEQVAFLAQRGCRQIQGYHYARPRCAQGVVDYFARSSVPIRASE